MAQRYWASGKEKLVLLVLSDFDPSGEDIAHSFARSMRDDFGISKIVPMKVALNRNQIDRLGLPPQMTKAHHVRWWQRDTGPTDLNNGVLLCESCHHRIHDNGWDIRIDGIGTAARVWLIPPPHVDPARTPRLGGRARYDVAA